ncbi:MAG: AraC family transcriptional regulator [Clostridia bacterium]|nr:AraC family transcriptional regulator [Clostridia bacterium]
MFFNEPYVAIKILSVLELEWGENNRYAEGRPYHALSFRLHGGADFFYSNKKVHVTANDLLYVPSGMPYRMTHSAEHLYVVHFDILDKTKFSDFSLFTPHNKYEFQNLFRTLYTEWTSNQMGYQYNSASIFYKIMREIMKERWKQLPISSSQRLTEVVDYIHSNFTDSEMTVHMLANKFGTSETYFRSVFKSVMHKSPLRYIRDLRVNYALELLRSGYYSVTEIAAKSGFTDPKYFSKIMKEEFRMPPSVLKKQ